MTNVRVKWKYVTDAASSGYVYSTPQKAFDAAVRAGDWWRGAEKDGGTIDIRNNDGRGVLDGDCLEMMKAAL